MQISSVSQLGIKDNGIKHRSGKKQTKKNASLMEKMVLASIVTFIGYGWYFREEEIFSAEFGWGYWLGIIGGSLMLILMLYPMRKHVKMMRRWGPINIWFRFHMLFGILGPTAILYHANFSFGSINSNVALIAMLTVACSGLVGRFFYGKIHKGLYGQKTSLQELEADIQQFTNKLVDSNDEFSSEVLGHLEQINHTYSNKSKNFLSSMMFLPLLSLIFRNKRVNCKKLLNRYLTAQVSAGQLNQDAANQIAKTFTHLISQYLQTTRKVFEFNVYSKIFSYWHILHLPLFIIMLVTGLFHVYAVHVY